MPLYLKKIKNNNNNKNTARRFRGRASLGMRALGDPAESFQSVQAFTHPRVCVLDSRVLSSLKTQPQHYSKPPALGRCFQKCWSPWLSNIFCKFCPCLSVSPFSLLDIATSFLKHYLFCIIPELYLFLKPLNYIKLGLAVAFAKVELTLNLIKTNHFLKA